MKALKPVNGEHMRDYLVRCEVFDRICDGIERAADHGDSLLTPDEAIIEIFRWTLRPTPSIAFHGKCWYNSRIIEINENLWTVQKSQFYETLSHEVAHAVAWHCFDSNSHDSQFRYTHHQLGGSGKTLGPKIEDTLTQINRAKRRNIGSKAK